MKPRIVLVPLSLYKEAYFLLNSNEVRSLGNYSLYECDGKMGWMRRRDTMLGNTKRFPNHSDEFGFEIKTTGAMRKRGYEQSYYWKDWNEKFPAAKAGRPY